MISTILVRSHKFNKIFKQLLSLRLKLNILYIPTKLNYDYLKVCNCINNLKYCLFVSYFFSRSVEIFLNVRLESDLREGKPIMEVHIELAVPFVRQMAF